VHHSANWQSSHPDSSQAFKLLESTGRVWFLPRSRVRGPETDGSTVFGFVAIEWMPSSSVQVTNHRPPCSFLEGQLSDEVHLKKAGLITTPSRKGTSHLNAKRKTSSSFLRCHSSVLVLQFPCQRHSLRLRTRLYAHGSLEGVFRVDLSGCYW
jgi:hypothetical protein